MEVIDIDAGSFRDWLAQTEVAGQPRSSVHCPLALFLDEIEGGEHFVDRKDRRYFAGLSESSVPAARLEPGQKKLLPGWAQYFAAEIDTIEEECIDGRPVSGAEVLDWALQEQQWQASDACSGK